jgi:shikimate dehydrogenase
MKKLYGLIGYPLEHSFSARYFSGKFEKESVCDCDYLNFPLEDINELVELISRNANLKGLNVTIPYKEEVIPFLNHIDEDAKKIAAVNTIKIIREKEDFQLCGFNTDIIGFKKSLLPFLNPQIKKALILGSGGASKAVMYVLKNLGIEFTLVSRRGQYPFIKYEDLNEELMESSKLIINTTPLGTFPNIDACPPIPYEFLREGHVLFDLVYNPHETLFLRKAKAMGAVIKNGLEMLELQAEASWKIWNS